jgi:pimeloyl-ACP methyl ester carboxylesterase
VLVHGSWSNRNNWQAVADDLARYFRVVAYDRRGHGLSERGVEATRPDHEDDLAALIETLGVGPVNVVGTSFGAAIALGLATRRPDVVRSVVAHEPPLISLVADEPEIRDELDALQAAVQAVVARVDRGDAAGAAWQFVEEIALGPGTWDLLPPQLRDTMVDSAPTFVVEQNDPNWASVEPAALASIARPVLLTQGDASPAWFRSIVARLADAIDGAEVHTYRGAGHAPHLTHPADYHPTVTGFLLGSSQRAGAAA